MERTYIPSNGHRYPPSTAGQPPSAPSTLALQPHGASQAPTLAALASALVSRLTFAREHGVTFGGKRDLYASLGWPRELGYSDYEALYRRGGIARRIVDLWPAETWSHGAELVEDPDPSVETAFEADTAELFQRLDAWGKLRRADILRSLGTFSAVLIGAPGELTEPLPQLNASSNVRYLRPYGQNCVTVNDRDIDNDTSSPRYGQPEMYSINVPTGVTGNTTHRVHWTRILHMADDTLDDDLCGRPYLEAAYNDFLALSLIIGGGSEAFWRNVFGGKTFLDLDPAVKFRNDAERDSLADEIEELYHGAKDYIRSRGITPKRITHTVANFDVNVETVLRLIGGTYEIPWRVLVGAELGLRSSDNDKKQVEDKAARRRRAFAEPLVREFVTRLQSHSALPATPDGYDFVWPESEELTEQQKGVTAESISKANEVQARVGDKPLMTSDEIRQRIWRLGPIEDTDFVDDGSDDVDGSDSDDGTTPNDDDTLPAAQSTFRAMYDTADSAPDDAEWRVIHRVADASRNALAAHVRDAFIAARDTVDVAALREDVASGNPLLVQQRVGMALEDALSTLRSTMQSRLLTIADDAGMAAVRSVRAKGGFFRANAARINATFSVTFDAISPRTIAWAQQRSARLVTEIDTTTRAALRTLVSTSFIEGIPPRRLATIVRLSIGLRTDQIRALQGYITSLPSSLTEQQRLSRIERRSNRLLRQRAVLIARTETINAANQGQGELWLQSRDKGLLPPDQQREWIVTPDSRNDTCPICPPMAGQRRGLDEPFETGEGGLVHAPTAHPNCRCAVGLAERV